MHQNLVSKDTLQFQNWFEIVVPKQYIYSHNKLLPNSILPFYKINYFLNQVRKMTSVLLIKRCDFNFSIYHSLDGRRWRGNLFDECRKYRYSSKGWKCRKGCCVICGTNRYFLFSTWAPFPIEFNIKVQSHCRGGPKETRSPRVFKCFFIRRRFTKVR